MVSMSNAGDILTSNSYNMLLNQTFLYGDHLLTINCFYTKVSQDVNTYFYNTKLDADAGGYFKLNNKLNIGASLVYGYFKNAYTNIGVKGSVTTNALKNIQVDLNLDLRKNIQLINPLFNQFLNELHFKIRYQIIFMKIFFMKSIFLSVILIGAFCIVLQAQINFVFNATANGRDMKGLSTVQNYQYNFYDFNWKFGNRG